MYDMYPEWGPGRHRDRQPTTARWPASRPDSTCETTAASAPTTTRSPGVQSPAPPAVQTFQLAVIPGDGIGPEVTAEALKVLEQVARPAPRA